MRLLLIPDATAPNGVDAFCQAMAKEASARGHVAEVEAGGGKAMAGADAVLVNSLQPEALAAARAAGCKVALRLIDSFSERDQNGRVEIRQALQADLLLVPSLYLESLLREWGANGQVRQVPYAYEHIMAQQIALVTMRAARSQAFSIVARSPMTAVLRTGLETLLSAVARLRIDWHLSLFGEGPERARLESKAQQLLCADRVSFLGEAPDSRIMEYLRTAKAYVDPVGLQGFPVMALHALSEGCPVISVSAGAVPELIKDGENGLLVPPDDARALSEAIVTLASVKGLSLRLIAAGIKTVERRSWGHTVQTAFNAIETAFWRGGSPAVPTIDGATGESVK